VPGDVLSTRELNRALLGRQLLLERSELPVANVLEHLVGLQAQEPWDPYYALWSRLRGFDPYELGGMIERFEAVRMGVMRGTIHLMTARDALVLRGVMAPVMSGTYRSSAFSRQVEGVDEDELLAIAAKLTAAAPHGRTDLSRALSERWPDADFDALGYTATFLLPLVQAPPRAVWGKTKAAKWLNAEKTLGAEIEWDADPGEVVLRYLRAFGPAASKDVRAWCYRTGLREVVDGLRPQLRSFRSEEGAELLDVEDGLYPDPETPAPLRFLPEYDNAILGFADRSRVVPPAEGARPYWKGAVLVDGFGAGTWRFVREGKSVAIEVGAWRKLSRRELADVEAEAVALLEWAEPSGGTDVRIEVLD
jgi:Winged helix DNA-binding domain